MIGFLQAHPTITRWLHRGPLRGWIDRRVWADALSDPRFVLALEAGRADIAAGRVVEFEPSASVDLMRHITAAVAEAAGDKGAFTREIAAVETEREAAAREAVSRRFAERRARIHEMRNDGTIDDRELADRLARCDAEQALAQR